MQACARCQYPIPTGEEVWIRRKSDNSRVPLCSQCSAELRRKKSKPAHSAIPQTPAPMTANKSGKIPIDSVLILTLIVLVAAPIVGILLAFIGSYIYLIIAFPIFTGLTSRFILSQGIRWGKLREPIVAGIFGLLFGLTVYGTYRYTTYRIYRSEVVEFLMDELMAEYGEADTETANYVFDELLVEETGLWGFFGAIILEAQEGMYVGPVSSDNEINIGTTLTLLYWLFEVGVMVGIPLFGGMAEAKRPYCEMHDRWYKNPQSLGGIEPANLKETLALLDMSQFNQFGRALNPVPPLPGVEIVLEHCPGCQHSSPLLTIKKVKKGSRGRKEEKILTQQYISPAQSDELLQSLATATS